jgi:hypothetical protein
MRSGVAWTRWKLEAEQAAEGFDDERLGDAGDAFEKGMALAEEGDEGFVDDARSGRR